MLAQASGESVKLNLHRGILGLSQQHLGRADADCDEVFELRQADFFFSFTMSQCSHPPLKHSYPFQC